MHFLQEYPVINIGKKKLLSLSDLKKVSIMSVGVVVGLFLSILAGVGYPLFVGIQEVKVEARYG
jgi:hypothetical protein